jgi:NitT/TauT family transport system ATP-binding protein
MTDAEGAIVVRDLHKVFYQRGTGTRVVAIERLDLTIARGEVVSIVGRTGCGKSTFLNMLLGLEAPSGGSITVDGKTPYGDFHAFKGRVGAVFQQDRLLPWRSALDNVKVGLEVLRVPAARRTAIATEWLDRLGLGGFYHAYPHELSGGMRQRVALARAFAMNVQILLADEAFGHLDEVTARQLRDEFVELSRTSGNTSVLVTHQLDEATEVGGRILVFGRPARLLADIRVADLSETERAGLGARIQRMIETDSPADAA